MPVEAPVTRAVPFMEELLMVFSFGAVQKQVPRFVAAFARMRVGWRATRILANAATWKSFLDGAFVKDCPCRARRVRRGHSGRSARLDFEVQLDAGACRPC